MDPDSFVGVNKAFRQSIGTVYASGAKLFSVGDPVRTVLCADAGVITDDFSAGLIAYPDICQIECSDTCSSADWEIASDPSCCGDAVYNYAPNNGAFLKNPELVKQYARHLGGTNIGFADGHAAWMNAQAVLNAIKEGDLNDPTGELEPWGPTSDDPPSCYPDAALIW